MPLYFITSVENLDSDPRNVKIGISKNIERRIGQLQTGSPHKLKLMGYIEANNDKKLEKTLHKKYSNHRGIGEWFCLNACAVLDELCIKSTRSYITVSDDPFEICSHDSDGIPEFVGAWQWGNIDYSQFCPKCGWGGGLSYNENWCGDGCLKCGFLSTFDGNNNEDIE